MADVKKVSELEEALVISSGNFVYLIQGNEIDGYTQVKVALSTVSNLIIGDVNAVLDAINGEVV